MEPLIGEGRDGGGGPPPPSPLTGCYLLVVVGEPHSPHHKDIILSHLAKGLLSWDVNNCLVDLEKELAIITEQGLDGEEARYGERLIQYASENLVTEILIHPAVSTLSQCVRNLLSSFTRHRHIIHSGYTFAANGSWAVQDGTFSITDFSEAFQEIEVQRVIRAYENSITVDIHCSPEGDWCRLPKEPFAKNCRVRLNPVDVLPSGSPAIAKFLNYIEPFLVPVAIETALESSEVVGNIRFSHPTLYVFPGGQGDAALFGINGFNMLLDGGFSRKACFWDFVRHLDRLDAVLQTRFNNSNVCGINSVLQRKQQHTVYPQIGHFFCNIQERKAILSPDGDKDKDPLLINLVEEGQKMIGNLKNLNLSPQPCYRDSQPINLYHKVGHGTLDMYVLSPAKDSKEVRDFLQKWNSNDQKLFANTKTSKDFNFPLPNLVSICALLVWQPSNPSDNITRIMFPGSTPQSKIFEGLDKLRHLECIKYAVCSDKSLGVTPAKKTKESVLDKIIPDKPQKILGDSKKDKPPKVPDNKQKENGLKAEVESKISETRTVKKADSTESDKSTPPKEEKLTNGKTDETKPKPKFDLKQRSVPKKADTNKLADKKMKTSTEKKSSPTTPKKTLDAKPEIDAVSKAKPKLSPSSTPAKSTKEANNRKMFESKNRTAPKREPAKPLEKKDAKTEKKPVPRRPKPLPPTTRSAVSPVKKVQKPESIAKKAKLEKEGTTDSSTGSTPSAEQENKRDISKFTPEELEQLRAQELADLQEEQEVVKEIEAVFRKGEEETDVADTDVRQIKNLSIDEKTDPEEYLIVEKEVIEIEPEQVKVQEDESLKHVRDSEESEKAKKQEENEIEVEEEKEDVAKETTRFSPEEKVESDRKPETELKDVAAESQPDEKISATAESGATTAPTLPEDERITLDEIKDKANQAVEEKYAKEETKEKEIPVIHVPSKTFETLPKIYPVVDIRLDKQSQIRDIVKTPDEVADLPVHEVADHYEYEHDAVKSPKEKAVNLEVKTSSVVKQVLSEVVKETEVEMQEEQRKTKEAESEIRCIVDNIIEESKESAEQLLGAEEELCVTVDVPKVADSVKLEDDKKDEDVPKVTHVSKPEEEVKVEVKIDEKEKSDIEDKIVDKPSELKHEEPVTEEIETKVEDLKETQDIDVAPQQVETEIQEEVVVKKEIKEIKSEQKLSEVKEPETKTLEDEKESPKKPVTNKEPEVVATDIEKESPAEFKQDKEQAKVVVDLDKQEEHDDGKTSEGPEKADEAVEQDSGMEDEKTNTESEKRDQEKKVEEVMNEVDEAMEKDLKTDELKEDQKKKGDEKKPCEVDAVDLKVEEQQVEVPKAVEKTDKGKEDEKASPKTDKEEEAIDSSVKTEEASAEIVKSGDTKVSEVKEVGESEAVSVATSDKEKEDEVKTDKVDVAVPKHEETDQAKAVSQEEIKQVDETKAAEKVVDSGLKEDQGQSVSPEEHEELISEEKKEVVQADKEHDKELTTEDQTTTKVDQVDVKTVKEHDKERIGEDKETKDVDQDADKEHDKEPTSEDKKLKEVDQIKVDEGHDEQHTSEDNKTTETEEVDVKTDKVTEAVTDSNLKAEEESTDQKGTLSEQDKSDVEKEEEALKETTSATEKTDKEKIIEEKKTEEISKLEEVIAAEVKADSAEKTDKVAEVSPKQEEVGAVLKETDREKEEQSKNTKEIAEVVEKQEETIETSLIAEDVAEKLSESTEPGVKSLKQEVTLGDVDVLEIKEPVAFSEDVAKTGTAITASDKTVLPCSEDKEKVIDESKDVEAKLHEIDTEGEEKIEATDALKPVEKEDSDTEALDVIEKEDFEEAEKTTKLKGVELIDSKEDEKLTQTSDKTLEVKVDKIKEDEGTSAKEVTKGQDKSKDDTSPLPEVETTKAVVQHEDNTLQKDDVPVIPKVTKDSKELEAKEEKPQIEDVGIKEGKEIKAVEVAVKQPEKSEKDDVIATATKDSISEEAQSIKSEIKQAEEEKLDKDTGASTKEETISEDEQANEVKQGEDRDITKDATSKEEEELKSEQVKEGKEDKRVTKDDISKEVEEIKSVVEQAKEDKVDDVKSISTNDTVPEKAEEVKSVDDQVKEGKQDKVDDVIGTTTKDTISKEVEEIKSKVEEVKQDKDVTSITTKDAIVEEVVEIKTKVEQVEEVKQDEKVISTNTEDVVSKEIEEMKSKVQQAEEVKQDKNKEVLSATTKEVISKEEEEIKSKVELVEEVKQDKDVISTTAKDVISKEEEEINSKVEQVEEVKQDNDEISSTTKDAIPKEEEQIKSKVEQVEEVKQDKDVISTTTKDVISKEQEEIKSKVEHVEEVKQDNDVISTTTKDAVSKEIEEIKSKVEQVEEVKQDKDKDVISTSTKDAISKEVEAIKSEDQPVKEDKHNEADDVKSSITKDEVSKIIEEIKSVKEDKQDKIEDVISTTTKETISKEVEQIKTKVEQIKEVKQDEDVISTTTEETISKQIEEIKTKDEQIEEVKQDKDKGVIGTSTEDAISKEVEEIKVEQVEKDKQEKEDDVISTITKEIEEIKTKVEQDEEVKHDKDITSTITKDAISKEVEEIKPEVKGDKQDDVIGTTTKNTISKEVEEIKLEVEQVKKSDVISTAKDVITKEVESKQVEEVKQSKDVISTTAKEEVEEIKSKVEQVKEDKKDDLIITTISNDSISKEVKQIKEEKQDTVTKEDDVISTTSKVDDKETGKAEEETTSEVKIQQMNGDVTTKCQLEDSPVDEVCNLVKGKETVAEATHSPKPEMHMDKVDKVVATDEKQQFSSDKQREDDIAVKKESISDRTEMRYVLVGESISVKEAQSLEQTKEAEESEMDKTCDKVVATDETQQFSSDKQREDDIAVKKESISDSTETRFVLVGESISVKEAQSLEQTKEAKESEMDKTCDINGLRKEDAKPKETEAAATKDSILNELEGEVELASLDGTSEDNIDAAKRPETVFLEDDSMSNSFTGSFPDFIVDKTDLGRKSPKERERDVAKIVASVAEVLKSEAPLEEFAGKIPLEIVPFVPCSSFTTELRETHITTVDSPLNEFAPSTTLLQNQVIVEESEETKDAEACATKDSKISDLIKNSNELLEASSKMISEIKSARAEKSDGEEVADSCGVTRMLVTASSEDGGEETVICPPGTITFTRSESSSGRTSPDPQHALKMSEEIINGHIPSVSSTPEDSCRSPTVQSNGHVEGPTKSTASEAGKAVESSEAKAETKETQLESSKENGVSTHQSVEGSASESKKSESPDTAPDISEVNGERYSSDASQKSDSLTELSQLHFEKSVIEEVPAKSVAEDKKLELAETSKDEASPISTEVTSSQKIVESSTTTITTTSSEKSSYKITSSDVSSTITTQVVETSNITHESLVKEELKSAKDSKTEEKDSVEVQKPTSTDSSLTSPQISTTSSESKPLSGKSTPDFSDNPDSLASTIDVTEKYIPEPTKTEPATKLESDLCVKPPTGKSTPEDLKVIEDSRKFSITPETTKTPSVTSGKSTPECFDEPQPKNEQIPSTSLAISPATTTLSGKSTPDIAEVESLREMQEILKHEKHVPGRSTPPTVPVSPIVKEMSAKECAEERSPKAKKIDPMSASFYGELPSDDEPLHPLASVGEDLMTSSFIGTELPSSSSKETDPVDAWGKPLNLPDPVASASSLSDELIAAWGKPLNLPSPAPPNDNKGTPKKERKLPGNVSAKNKLNDERKRAESPSKKQKKNNAVYVDLTYVPHHGNSYYTYVDFFKRIRARYYVFSGIEPSKEVYNALLEAKQTWEDKNLEVTIIPTYDTDVLGYWVAENEDLLTKHKIDLSPSASRCTINLQDHETSCSAYRLEF